MEIKKIVPDTSVIIEGKITEMVKKNEVKGLKEIIIPRCVLDELQAQASMKRETGYLGLEELKVIRRLCEEKKIDLRFTGERPTLEEIKLAKGGRLDAIIRDVAKDERATLITGDYAQALTGEAEGVKVEYLPPEVEEKGPGFEKYFTEDTMSVHLKEDVVPMAKKGKPGSFKLEKIGKEKLTKEELDEMIKEIIEVARRENLFIDAERGGAVVVQMGINRIAIARPPFSEGLEITIVRPIVKLGLKDYKLSERLVERLKNKAEGILIAGPPGSGKSTLAASVAEFYLEQGKIIKTLESPRDLQLGPEITQYGPLNGDFSKTADILLLVRPDYSIFDEVRQPKDFRLFADMRLAGVGMIGVVHASEAVDAVQRFIGKIELGMIPHVMDTVVFLKDGEIKNVYELSLTVRTPTGMNEADLARPLVEIKDFEDGKLMYEIYTFGEENIVIPVSKTEKKKSGLQQLAEERIRQEMMKYDKRAEIEFLSENSVMIKVKNDAIPRLIGKEGMNITRIEDELGIHIDVEPKIPTTGKEIKFKIEESGNSLHMVFAKKMIGKNVSVHIKDNFLLSATVGKKSEIRISKSSEIGSDLIRAIVGKKKIRVLA